MHKVLQWGSVFAIEILEKWTCLIYLTYPRMRKLKMSISNKDK